MATKAKLIQAAKEFNKVMALKPAIPVGRRVKLDALLADIKEAAEEFRVKPRHFRDVRKRAEAVVGHPIGILIGTKMRLYADYDMEIIEEAHRCSGSSSEGGSGICAGPSEAFVSTKLQELLTPTRQKNTGSAAKRGSGTGRSSANVVRIPSAKRP